CLQQNVGSIRVNSTPAELVFVSLAADNAAPFYRGLVAHLSGVVRRTIRFLDEVPWQEGQRRLLRGEAHLGLVCGLQYVHAVDRRAVPGLDLLGAPIMGISRYENRPIYYSDVVTRAGHPARTFDDLR